MTDMIIKRKIELAILIIGIIMALCACNKKTAGKDSDGVSNLKFGSRNIEIVSWEKNGFIMPIWNRTGRYTE